MFGKEKLNILNKKNDLPTRVRVDRDNQSFFAYEMQ